MPVLGSGSTAEERCLKFEVRSSAHLSIVCPDLCTQVPGQLQASHPCLHAGHLVSEHLSFLQLLAGSLQHIQSVSCQVYTLDSQT